MKIKLKDMSQHIVLVFPVLLITLLTICSRWVTDYLLIPDIITKLATVAIYAPFLCFVLWKFVCDISKPEKNLLNLSFYIFGVYYAGLTAFRFLTGAEVKENLYYTAIFLGSLALFMLIQNNKLKTSLISISRCVFIFTFILLIYYLVYFSFIKRILYSCPINEITLGATLVILLPVISAIINKFKDKKIWIISGTVLIFGIVFTIMSLSSRAVFTVMCIALASLFLIHVNNKKVIVSIVSGTVSGLVVIAILFAFNISSIRFAVYRETNLASLTGFIDNLTEKEETTKSEENTTKETTSQEENSTEEETTKPEEKSTEEATTDPLAGLVTNQIDKSDSMRSTLFKQSLEEVKKNILFGTGNIFFEHEYRGTSGMVNAPVHNIVLATLNCYGAIGLILILIIILLICSKFRIFDFKSKNIQTKLTLIVLFGLYFGISMIQATGYDTLVMPIFFIGLAVFSKLTNEDKTEIIAE